MNECWYTIVDAGNIGGDDAKIIYSHTHTQSLTLHIIKCHFIDIYFFFFFLNSSIMVKSNNRILVFFPCAKPENSSDNRKQTIRIFFFRKVCFLRPKKNGKFLVIEPFSFSFFFYTSSTQEIKRHWFPDDDDDGFNQTKKNEWNNFTEKKCNIKIMYLCIMWKWWSLDR